MPFAIRNFYLNRFHSGFRSVHSTGKRYRRLHACECRFVTVLLLLYFFKAFDSVIQNHLCNKLLSSLIRSYLSDRFRWVSVGDELSSLVPTCLRSRPLSSSVALCWFWTSFLGRVCPVCILFYYLGTLVTGCAGS
jgi:hypothetical protein